MQREMVSWAIVCGVIVAGVSGTAFGQTVSGLKTPAVPEPPAGLVANTATLEPSAAPAQYAVPAGATAGTNASNASGNAVLGFQVWKKDSYFLKAEFNFALAQTISSAYGAALLNPSEGGNSLVLAGNRRIVSLFRGAALLNAAGRGGASMGDWAVTSGSGTTQMTETHQGGLMHVAALVQLTTKTYSPEKSSDNEYQLGVEAGVGARAIVNSLGSSQQEAFRQMVFGTTDTAFLGFESAVFARVNSLQPFLRVTHYGGSIDGFSGWNAFLGVTVLAPLFSGTLN